MPFSAIWTRQPPYLPVVLCCLLVTVGVAGCGVFTPATQHTAALGSTKHADSPPPSPSPSPSPTPTATPQYCAHIALGFTCSMRNRIQRALRYLRNQPGSLGIVVHDRVTGAVWENGNATVAYPAASTMKLAMMADLLLRNHNGTLSLSSGDMQEMYQALNTSNDNDANDLWSRYEDGSFLNRIQGFGMSTATFTSSVPNWGFMYCSAQDLDNLMNYVLGSTPPAVRDYLVKQLQNVSPIDQQWGVWGAGPQNAPGNKDGWEYDPPWITDTVGFAGPNQRYTVAIMYNLEDYGDSGNTGFNFGTNVLTQISALLFQGHFTAPPSPQASAVP